MDDIFKNLPFSQNVSKSANSIWSTLRESLIASPLMGKIAIFLDLPFIEFQLANAE